MNIQKNAWMNLIGRITANTIAAQIVGIKTKVYKPTNHLWGLTGTWELLGKKGICKRVTKQTLNHFLRLNNRRLYQYFDDFTKARYPMVEHRYDISRYFPPRTIDKDDEMHEWCRETYGPHGYVYFGDEHYGYFFFATEQDRISFIMRYS